MFRILKVSGEELGLVDYVHYIKIGASGDYAQAKADEAIGVAVNGNPYLLEDIVIAEISGGQAFAERQTANELVFAELAEAQALDQVSNELALAELAEMIIGG